MRTRTKVVLGASAAVGVHLLRQHQLRRPQAAINHEDFPGVIYEVGAAYVAHRPAHAPVQLTVVAVAGFLEDFRYFTELYADPALELILINNSGYHCPDQHQTPRRPTWAEPIAEEVGSIEYDARVLNLALSHLAQGQQLRVHGHSRGGAVVLEAARQAPAAFKTAEVILEAPVLPGAAAYPLLELAFNPVGLYLLPFNFALLKRSNPELFAKWMYPPLNPRKLELIKGLYFNPRSYEIILKNVHSMRRWITQTDRSIYACVRQGMILIPEHDTVLDRASMLASARLAAPALQVVETRGTSHFVTLDQPQVVPPLLRRAS